MLLLIRRFFLFSLLVLGSSFLAAQESGKDDSESLRQKVDELEKRLLEQQQELEEVRDLIAEKENQPPSGVGGPQAEAPPGRQPSSDVLIAESGLADEAETSLPLDLSGYFSGRYFDDSRSDSHSRFQAHVVSLFLGKTLGRWKFFSEVEFEYAPKFDADGEGFSTSRGEVLLETAWLDYEHRDWLNTRAGYMLVPTYWRVHHYPSITLTVSNPLMDKRIFPASITGVMGHGSKYYETGGFTYSLFMGNGRGPDPGRRDVNDHKAVGGKFVAHLPSGHRLDTLDLGVISYRDKLENGERENIYGFESRIEKGRLGFLAEFARANIEPNGGGLRYFREGYYLQPWVRLTRQLRVVYRYDTLDFDSRVSHKRDAERHTFGLNFRPRPTVSLKVEYNRYKPEALTGQNYHGVAAGVAFFFQ